MPLSAVIVDVPLFMERFAALLHRTLDVRIEVRLEVAKDCPSCRADPVGLEAALVELVVNARDAMPDGGILVLRAWSCESVSVLTQANVDTHDAGCGHVAISVGDNGLAMTARSRERFADQFGTPRSRTGGFGTGLRAADAFASRSGGILAIDAQHPRGTVVTIVLPSAQRLCPSSDADDAALGNGTGDVS